MPELAQKTELTLREALEITGKTSALTFIPGVIYNIWITNRVARSPASSVVKRGFINQYKGAIFWDLICRFPFSATFPSQLFLEQKIIEHLAKDELTLHKKAIISAFSGWFVAMTEIILFYPIDSMRVVMQTHPELFKRCGIPYFLKNQHALRRGLGISILRSTLGNCVAWPIKTITQDYLLETKLHKDSQSIITAFAFTLSRVMIGHPFDLARLVIQCHSASHPTEKIGVRKTAALVKNRLQNEGLSFLKTGLGSRTLFAFFATGLQISLVQRCLDAKQSPPCSRS